MQIVLREKFYRKGIDYLIIVFKDDEGSFHTEIYQIAGELEGDSNSSVESVIVDSKKKIDYKDL